MRKTTFHIYESKDPAAEPLYWDDKLLDFDTETAARSFIEYAINSGEVPEDFFDGADIRYGFVYNDDGYLNATFLRVMEGGELYNIEGQTE